MVGCKISKISTDRAIFRRTRLRPLVLQQIAAMRTWRLPARSPKDNSYKKSLLLEEKTLESNSVVVATVIGNTYGLKVSTKPKLHPQLEDGHDDDQCRMIARGSPSFRIFSRMLHEMPIYSNLVKTSVQKRHIPRKRRREVSKRKRRETEI